MVKVMKRISHEYSDSSWDGIITYEIGLLPSVWSDSALFTEHDK